MLVKKDMNVPLFDLLTCLTDVIDLVDSKLSDHHKKVAYIAYCLAAQLGLAKKERDELLLAGKIHDIGALSGKERMDTLHFELSHSQRHAEIGAELLKGFKPLKGISQLVRFHHVFWDGGDGQVISVDSSATGYYREDFTKEGLHPEPAALCGAVPAERPA